MHEHVENGVMITSCPHCGADREMQIGQSSTSGKLRWYESLHCLSCGSISEADGDGFPPEEIRTQLIINEGLWRVSIDEIRSKKLVAHLLRNQLQLSLNETLLIIKTTPSNLYSGTKTEALWFCDLLEKIGEKPIKLKR